ncbi:MAG: hypothetical protein D6711_01145, partial [Chloroflexi bacterium]
MRKWLLIIPLILSACAGLKTSEGFFMTPTGSRPASSLQMAATPTPANPQAAALMATAQAAAAQETAVSAQATLAAQRQANATATRMAESAATATAVYQATADHLAFQATAVAINGTATAVYRLAELEERAESDQARFLLQQRQADELALERQAIVNRFLPVVFTAVLLLLVVVGSWTAVTMWRASQPIIDARGQVLALPRNRYEMLPNAARQQPQSQPQDEAASGEWVDARPVMLPPLASGHVMIVGVTGDGKSMALREVIEHRQGEVVVLDPHYTPGAWGQVRVIGGGRDFEAIQSYMEWMDEELSRRAGQRAGGQRHFHPLTVATEEMPAIIESGSGRVRRTWRRWMREGRKFGLFMVVVTQSTRVRSLGIQGEGDLLENFKHVLLLGGAAKAAAPELVQGMARPALLRSGTRPLQPVVIPYDPRRDPESPEFQANAALAAPAPVLHLPPGRNPEEPKGMATAGGFVTEQEIQQILQLAGQGISRREICRQMYDGNDGGAPYLRVKAVLDTF